MTPVIQGLHGLTGGFSGSFLDFSQTQIFDIFASSLCPSLLLTPPLGGDLHAPYFFPSPFSLFLFLPHSPTSTQRRVDFAQRLSGLGRPEYIVLMSLPGNMPFRPACLMCLTAFLVGGWRFPPVRVYLPATLAVPCSI